MNTQGTQIYCPYTGDLIDPSNTEAWSWDHVVPLFLGGDDKFQIKSSRKANNDIGSKIEAPMKNDFFLSFALRSSGIIERSGEITIPEWKNSVIDGRKTHIKLGVDSWTFWDKVDRRYLDISGRDKIPVQSDLKINAFNPLRLSAKIVLGTMVFLFSDEIRNDCDLGAFRTIMNMRSIDDLSAIKVKDFRILQKFDEEISQIGSEAFTWKLITEAFERTCLVIVPHEDSFSFHVAIAGQHQASFQFEADTSKVPRGGLFDIAHVILLGPGKMKQCSLRSVQAKIRARVEKLKNEAMMASEKPT